MKNFEKISFKIKNHKLSTHNIKIQYVVDYKPKKHFQEDDRDKWSKSILGVKNEDLESIEIWAKIISATIKKDTSFIIVCVPPSKANKISGIKKIVQQVGREKNMTIGEDLLFRSQSVQKQHEKRKSINEIKNTIKFNLNSEKIILNKHILLLDDIISTGNTILACSQILLSKGAKKVTALLLGSTLKVY